ncbi:hypothetical protein H5410_047579 [Solanum commersonii]|uniref:Uncharacterized protein n=1 Tax=Solanum commersonii TaxID=4109 RepID=A0A9J5XFI7_SOLCO|nr:hypothetical protein H5410_047579 [Solanum commersonii]
MLRVDGVHWCLCFVGSMGIMGWGETDVIMSRNQRPGKEITTISQRKRVRSGGNVPSAAVPRGETRRFGLRAVMRGVDVTLTRVVLNDIVGTSLDVDPLVLTLLNIRPPY